MEQRAIYNTWNTELETEVFAVHSLQFQNSADSPQ